MLTQMSVIMYKHSCTYVAQNNILDHSLNSSLLSVSHAYAPGDHCQTIMTEYYFDNSPFLA